MLSNIIVRLVIYYAAWLLALSGLFHLFPQILYYVAQERERIFIAKTFAPGADAVPFPRGDIQEGVARLVDPAHTIPVMVAMVLAFAVTLPIAWVYCWTRPRKKYNQSFAKTLLAVPISIALVVFLVKGSLALAFSLAGIVAAVRFRTSLDEPIDAVYMFMAIGIGLAAGTQLTTVAYLASLSFVTVSLAVWKIDFGAQPAVLSGWSIVPPEKAVQAGGAGSEPIAPGRPRDARIEVHARKAKAAQKAAALVLESSTRQWQLANVVKNQDGTAIVAFDVWLKPSVDPASIVREIEEAGKKSINSVQLDRFGTATR